MAVRILRTTIDCLINFILLHSKANVNAYKEEIVATRNHVTVRSTRPAHVAFLSKMTRDTRPHGSISGVVDVSETARPKLLYRQVQSECRPPDSDGAASGGRVRPARCTAAMMRATLQRLFLLPDRSQRNKSA
jgi:hypothetical protein